MLIATGFPSSERAEPPVSLTSDVATNVVILPFKVQLT